ncbi:adenosylcobinamide-phosphate synthase CbiB [Bacillaceae bacterium]
MSGNWTIVAAFLVDLLVGDPRGVPHPVVYMGKAIVILEKWIRTIAKTEKNLKRAGALLPLTLVGGSYLLCWLLLAGLERIAPWLAWGAEVWLISTTIATKGLAQAGLEIYELLAAGRIPEARRALSMVVGRDTDKLDEREISRGAVETVAENIVDAIISPLFYAALGGAPLAMAYRAANTLDSMVGYKDDRYRELGWASARLDDLANYLPARLAAWLIVCAAWLLRLNGKNAWRIARRDARLHPSPNSGWPEAAVAGALEIRLGGLNYYRGVPSLRPPMGDPRRPIAPGDILEAVRIARCAAWLFLSLCLVSSFLFSLIFP